MTIRIELNESQIKDVVTHNQQQAAAIIGAAKPNAIGDKGFVFFAAFDGTNNDMNYHPTDRYDTNVAQLWREFQNARVGKINLGGGYYAGVGTSGTLTQSSWLPPNVTQQAIATARRAYDDFCVQASNWLSIAGNAGKPLTAVVACFSRGDASAAVFSQMLYAEGLPDLTNPEVLLVKPGTIAVSAGVLFDPVTTGVSVNLAFAPTATNIVAIKAMNEYRYLFIGADYSDDPDSITTIAMYGNHCDVGGGYDRGLSAIALEAATGFLKKSGLPIADVAPNRRFVPEEAAIHSEEYDREGGNKIWDVYNEDGFSFKDLRMLIDVGTPAAPGTPFTLFDGKSVTIP